MHEFIETFSSMKKRKGGLMWPLNTKNFFFITSWKMAKMLRETEKKNNSKEMLHAALLNFSSFGGCFFLFFLTLWHCHYKSNVLTNDNFVQSMFLVFHEINLSLATFRINPKGSTTGGSITAKQSKNSF